MSSSHEVCKSLELVRSQLSSRLSLLAKSALVCCQILTFLPLNISLRLSCRDCYIFGIYVFLLTFHRQCLCPPGQLNTSIIYLAPRACLRLGISRFGSSSSRTIWNPPVIPALHLPSSWNPSKASQAMFGQEPGLREYTSSTTPTPIG